MTCIVFVFEWSCMYPESYEKLSASFRDRPRAVSALRAVDKTLVVLVAASYFTLLLYLLLKGDSRLLRTLLVPAISFVAMSIVRAVVNAPRPYERYDIEPLIPSDTHGKSFPGRHAFSAAVIACALLYVSVPAGIGGFIATVLIAITRVVSGVHFPRDVIAGSLLGVLCGIVGFWVIP